MSIKERLALFEANAKGNSAGPGIQKKISVIDEGNIKELRERAKLRAAGQIQVKESASEFSNLKASLNTDIK